MWRESELSNDLKVEEYFPGGEISLQQKLGSLAYRPVSVEEAALPACNHEINFQWTFHWSKLWKK
jgi:hypothetical protein